MLPLKPVLNRWREIDILGYKYLTPIVIGQGIVLRWQQAQWIAYKNETSLTGAEKTAEGYGPWLLNNGYNPERQLELFKLVLIPGEGAPPVEEIFDYIPVSIARGILDFFNGDESNKSETLQSSVPDSLNTSNQPESIPEPQTTQAQS